MGCQLTGTSIVILASGSENFHPNFLSVLGCPLLFSRVTTGNFCSLGLCIVPENWAQHLVGRHPPSSPAPSCTISHTKWDDEICVCQIETGRLGGKINFHFLHFQKYPSQLISLKTKLLRNKNLAGLSLGKINNNPQQQILTHIPCFTHFPLSPL